MITTITTSQPAIFNLGAWTNAANGLTPADFQNARTQGIQAAQAWLRFGAYRRVQVIAPWAATDPRSTAWRIAFEREARNQVRNVEREVRPSCAKSVFFEGGE